MTEGRVGDASVVAEPLGQCSDSIERFIGEGASEKAAVYDLLNERGAEVIVKPKKNARVSRSGAAGARNASGESVCQLGRME